MVFSSCQCDPSFGYRYLRYLELHRTDLRVRKIAKKTINFIMCARPSVCPHGTTWLPEDEF
jgi:hypothetical protein